MTQKSLSHCGEPALKQEIADVLLTELQDERLHGLTVTEVPDLRDLETCHRVYHNS